MKQNEIVTPDYREYHILEKWTDEFVFVKLNYVHIYSKIINQLQVIAVLNDPFQSDKWAKYVQTKKQNIYNIYKMVVGWNSTRLTGFGCGEPPR